MLVQKGSVWDFADSTVVIPTNCGWSRTGEAVMGAGMALQAAQRYPGLAAWYGAQCRVVYPAEVRTLRHPDWPLILFPTKPLDRSMPHMSWRHAATMDRIRRSVRELVGLYEAPERREERVVLPAVGAGLGRLPLAEVMPLLVKHLDDRFTLVSLE